MQKYIRKIRNRHYVILALFLTIYCCNTMCTTHRGEPASTIQNAYGQTFAGDEACQSCHRDIFKSHAQTAHYRDSRTASAATIRGSFDSGRNRFLYNKSIEVEMGHTDSGFFETAYRDGVAYAREPFGIVVGSGRKGQTYLYWNNGKLFQLPVSYFTKSDSWCNSPGYAADSPRFNRPVPASCLECHASNARTVFRSKTEFGDAFDKSQMIYGITCERCHGPGAAHVDFHRSHPGEKSGQYIVNSTRLSRQQRLDACALCHSGSRYPLKPAFSFRVGDRLDNFSQAKFNPETLPTLDVHGNQYGLLSSSKCYIQSQMDCSSCHNVHVNEHGNTELFSQRCMSCHNGVAHKSCTMPPTAGLVLGNNCIDCHMPALPSQKIVLELSNIADTGKTISNLVRTHHIAIYPDYTKAYLQKLPHP